MEQRKKQKLLLALCIVGFIIGIIWIIVGTSESCNGASSKIEIIEEPKMTMVIGSYDIYPRVSVKVKNKTNSMIDVAMACTIYDTDGNVTQNISSNYVKLAAGETTTLVAETSWGYSFLEYYQKCASFGNVEYKFLKI